MFLLGLLGAVLLIVYNNFIIELIAGIRIDSLTIFFKVISSTIFIILLFLFYSYLLKEKKNIVLFLISIILIYLVIELLKNIFKVPRPIGADETGYSFPSRHAALAFGTFVIMNLRYMKYKWAFLSVAILITFSRLYLGVHYLGDLIIGGAIGYYMAVFIDKKWK